jgi:hypothetical protein
VRPTPLSRKTAEDGRGRFAYARFAAGGVGHGEMLMRKAGICHIYPVAPPPNASNASSNSAKTNFGLISVSQHKQKIQDRERRSWIVF